MIIISKTGYFVGRGSMPHRYAAGLSKSEQQHVKNGGIVLIPDGNPHYMCTPYKQVYWSQQYGYRFKNYNGTM